MQKATKAEDDGTFVLLHHLSQKRLDIAQWSFINNKAKGRPDFFIIPSTDAQWQLQNHSFRKETVFVPKKHLIFHAPLVEIQRAYFPPLCPSGSLIFYAW